MSDLLYHLIQDFSFHGVDIEVVCSADSEQAARLCGAVIAAKLWELDLTELPED